MAAGMESFSIREYASRMRSVGVVKCWPFEEAEEETVKTMLPPITIKKFRWWFDELELVRSNCAHYGESSRKKLQEEGEISDLESETVESMRLKRFKKVKPVRGKLKLKNKAPKKRSIVELFALSPQVERVNSDDDENEDNAKDAEESDSDSVQEGGFPNPKLLRGRNADSKCKRKTKVKKKGIANMLDKQKKVVKNLKEKVNTKANKLRENITEDARTPKKEKATRLKLISSVGFTASPKCSAHSSGVINAISSPKKEPRLKCLVTEKNKTLKTSKLLGKNKKLAFPVHGILKNQTKVFPAKKSTSCISEDVGKVNQCNTQHVDKHVTFSLNDDFLGPSRETNSTMELELQNFCNFRSDVTRASMVNGHTVERGGRLTIHQIEEVEEEIENCKENEINVQPVTGMQFSVGCHGVDAPDFLPHHVSGQEKFFNKSVTLGPVALHSENLQTFEGYNPGKSHDPSFTCSIPSMSQEGNIPKLTSPTFGHLPDASSSNGSLLASGYFTDFLKAYPQPPTSYSPILSENANCRSRFPSPVTRENYYDHSVQYPWLPHLSPKELMHNICSLSDRKPRVAITGETSMNENLVGLPLNSQGELIRLNSNVNLGYDHPGDTSSIVNPYLSSATHNNVPLNLMVDQAYLRSWNGAKSLNDQLRTCRIEDFGREMENLAIPSRLDTMVQHYGTRRTNIIRTGFDPSFLALKSEVDQAKMFYNRSSQGQQVQKHPGNPNHISLHFSQSTMRLMGQEFKIGGSELQELEDREVWMDKPIIKEQHANTATDSCIRSHDLPEFTVHPILTKLKDTVVHLSETEVNTAAGTVSQMMVPESEIFPQFLQSQNNIIHQDGYGIGKGNIVPEIYPHFSLASSPLSGSGKTTCQDPFLFGYKCPTASQTLIPASLFQETTENVSWSWNELKKKQKPPNPSNLAFKFPFLDKECRRHIQPSWSQNSFNVMAPSCLESREKGTLMDYYSTYSSPSNSLYDWSISGIDHQIEPSVYPTLEPFYPFPQSTLQNSLASSSLVHCPLMPVHPLISPYSASQNRYGEKMKVENCVKSRTSVRMPDHGRRSKKRLASVSDDSVKHTKMPKLGIQEDSRHAVTAVKCPNFEHDVHCGKEVVESALAKDRASTMQCGAAHKDEDRVCCGMAFDKLQGAPKSGPVKLTAGARYVLKPCPKKEQTNSSPSHSSIPFAETATAGRVLTSEKSAKVYRF